MAIPPENSGEKNSLPHASAPKQDDPAPADFAELPEEIQTVAKTIMVSLTSFLKTGQDPETARLAAQAEMHEESCRLDAYKENLKNRDQKNTRDHAYRMKKLNHETVIRVIFSVVCVLGLAAGFYIYRNKPATGSTIMTASFMTLLYILTGKSVLHRNSEE